MKAGSVGKGRLGLGSPSSAANEPKIDIVFMAKPCAVCGKNTLGWGMVTDIHIHVSQQARFKQVCSRRCNEKFYSEMSGKIIWKTEKLVIDPNTGFTIPESLLKLILKGRK